MIKSVDSAKISCSDDSDAYYGHEEFDSMDDEVILSKIKDELDLHTGQIKENTNFIREVASHIRTTERAITQQFDNKLITLKNVMVDELRRLHSITEKEDMKLYELIIWSKEKMYQLTEKLDANHSSLDTKVMRHNHDFLRTSREHAFLLDRNNIKINGLIG